MPLDDSETFYAKPRQRPRIRSKFVVPITPTSEPLTIRIACRTNNGPTRHHRVAVHADGSVDTPHDLDLEEIAQRLGGGRPPNCLVFARDVVPLVLNELPVLHRRERPDIAIASNGRVRHLDALRCCRVVTPSRAPRGIKEICDHVRSLAHLHVKYDSRHYLIGVLLDQISRSWDGLVTAPTDQWGAAEYVPPGLSLQDWWDIGIHPQDVSALAEASTLPGEQIPLFGHDVLRAAYPSPYESSEEEAESLVRRMLCVPPADLDPESRDTWF